MKQMLNFLFWGLGLLYLSCEVSWCFVLSFPIVLILFILSSDLIDKKRNLELRAYENRRLQRKAPSNNNGNDSDLLNWSHVVF